MNVTMARGCKNVFKHKYVINLKTITVFNKENNTIYGNTNTVLLCTLIKKKKGCHIYYYMKQVI